MRWRGRLLAWRSERRILDRPCGSRGVEQVRRRRVRCVAPPRRGLRQVEVKGGGQGGEERRRGPRPLAWRLERRSLRRPCGCRGRLPRRRCGAGDTTVASERRLVRPQGRDFVEHATRCGVDVLCIQETRLDEAEAEQLRNALEEERDVVVCSSSAAPRRKGGVAILTRRWLRARPGAMRSVPQAQCCRGGTYTVRMCPPRRRRRRAGASGIVWRKPPPGRGAAPASSLWATGTSGRGRAPRVLERSSAADPRAACR